MRPENTVAGVVGAAPEGVRAGRATVTAVAGARRVALAWERGGHADAVVALPGYDAPRVGDDVVAVADETGATWVVGLLRALREVDAPPAPAPGAAPARVHDRDGALLFEHDPATGRSVLHAPRGDLEIRADHGRLELGARDGVRVESDGAIAMRSARGVELTVGDAAAAPTTAVRLEPRAVRVVTSVLAASAEQAELLAARVRATATVIETAAERVRTAAGVLETDARRIVERAHDTYREVQDLAQTRAGRLRLVARGAAYLLGQRAVIKTERDVKIQGEKIYLS